MKTTFTVITSIADATDAVRAFAARSDMQVVVVGDRKSPAQWTCPDAAFLSVQDQEALPFSLCTLLPYNHYCRKMSGYLWAMQRGAEVIYDTDDDNLPKAGWAIQPFQGTYRTSPPDRGFVNVLPLLHRPPYLATRF